MGEFNKANSRCAFAPDSRCALQVERYIPQTALENRCGLTYYVSYDFVDVPTCPAKDAGVEPDERQ
jgi:hypothetical protein